MCRFIEEYNLSKNSIIGIRLFFVRFYPNFSNSIYFIIIMRCASFLANHLFIFCTPYFAVIITKEFMVALLSG